MATQKQPKPTGKRETLQLGLRLKGIVTLIQAGQLEAAEYNFRNLVFGISLETRALHAHLLEIIPSFYGNQETDKMEKVAEHLIGLAIN